VVAAVVVAVGGALDGAVDGARPELVAGVSVPEQAARMAVAAMTPATVRFLRGFMMPPPRERKTTYEQRH